MADMTNVYLRIKYKKEGEIKEDDLLEDIDFYDAIEDMEYNGISYEVEDLLILRAYGRNYYPVFFEEESEQRNYLFEQAKLKGIERLYYIFCDFSYERERISFGLIEMDIEKREVATKIVKEQNYNGYLEKLFTKKEYSHLKKSYDKFQEDELEDEELDKYYEEVEEIVAENLLKEFKKFLKKVKLS